MTDLRFLTVHAHPDDETISVGGTLAILADRGVTTSVVCCTDGKLATIFGKDMPEDTTRPRLTEIRQAELRKAGAILGVGEVNFLGYGDSGMAGAESNNDKDAFWQADLDEVTGRLVAHIRRFRPHVIVTYDGWGGYGHPDHIQTHRATALAVEAAQLRRLYPDSGEPWRVAKLYYTAFPESVIRQAMEKASTVEALAPFAEVAAAGMEMAVPDEWVTTVVDVREGVGRIRDALRAHHSQMAEDFPFLAMPEDVHRDLFGKEHFRLVTSTVPVNLPETDLFAGIADVAEVTGAAASRS